MLVRAAAFAIAAGLWFAVAFLLLDPCRFREATTCEPLVPYELRLAQFLVAIAGVVLFVLLAWVLVRSLRDFMLRRRRRRVFVAGVVVVAVWTALYAYGSIRYQL